MTSSVNYKRPIYLAIILTFTGEMGLFLIFGIWAFPEGDLLSKLIWTGFYCGIGMGAVTGAMTVLLVLDNFTKNTAVIFGAIVAFAVLVTCNLLCLTVDQNYNYFGGKAYPNLFLWNGVIMALVGSLLYSWLLFSEKGETILKRIGL